MRLPYGFLRLLPVLMAMSGGVPHALPGQEARPTGVWVLDTLRSDSLHLPGRERWDTTGRGVSRGRPEGPGGEGPGVGPPGAGGLGPGMEGGRRYGGSRYGRGMNEKDAARLHQTLNLAREAPVSIAFDSGGRLVKFTDARGFETTLRTDGKRTRDTVFDGGDVYTRAAWDHEALVVEHRVDGGGKVSERYTLGLGGIRLLSFVEVDGLLQPLAFTRQFTRPDSSVATP
jgi:hypothetical protein